MIRIDHKDLTYLLDRIDDLLKENTYYLSQKGKEYYSSPNIMSYNLTTLLSLMQFINYSDANLDKRKLKKKLKRMIHKIESGDILDIINIDNGGE